MSFAEQERCLSKLSNIPQVAFNSFNKRHDSICLPETRVELLQEIATWADGLDERCIFWLNGLAGTGKSTIARTIARKYYEQRRLGASFFFSRGGGDAGHAGKFFTSIAVQLASKSPSLKQRICEAVADHSDISSQSLCDQWHHLVLGPLSQLNDNPSQSSLVLVVDALDECENELDIRTVVQLLAEAQSLRNLRLRVFMTSRPEIPIRHGFYQIGETGHRDFVLHNISSTVVDHDSSFLARPRRCMNDFRFEGASKHTTSLHAATSIPSSRTSVAMIRFLCLARNSVSVSRCAFRV